MANDGTALGALNEIIESAGGTPDAQTLVPAIEDLGEIIGSGGGGGGGTIADGSITTAKLAKNAVTLEKMANDSVGFSQLKSESVKERHLSPELEDTLASKSYVTNQTSYPTLVAADSTTAAALRALGYSDVPTLSPADTMMQTIFTNPKIRLCWISGTTLEVAPINFFGNLQTQAITLWAKGLHSTASGVLGVDESWTIAANA